jgi:hypothetical protein
MLTSLEHIQIPVRNMNRADRFPRRPANEPAKKGLPEPRCLIVLFHIQMR